MSGVTNTFFEELFASGQAATTTTPTAGAVSIIAGYPSVEVPDMYFTRLGKTSNSLKVYVSGQVTTTATIPTFLFGLAWTQARPAAFSASTVLAATAAFTPGSAVTAGWFDLEADIFLRTLALGAASVLFTRGSIRAGQFAPAAYSATNSDKQTLPATNVSGASTAAIDVDQPLFIWPYMTLGAATAGNTVTVQSMKVYGEN